MSSLDLKSKSKYLNIIIQTFDAEIELPVESTAKGKILFESICASLGLRETWYFGLSYESVNGYKKWLKMNKRLCDINFTRVSKNNSVRLMLLVKYFPEDVNELIQEYTQHLFYLQVREQIIKEEIICPAEHSIMLASYVAQIKYGDLSDISTTNLITSYLIAEIPKSIINKFQLTELQWEEKIKICWSNHSGLFKEEVELEYLKLASTLEMFGISYFEIRNKKNTQLWLGVDAFGLKIFQKEQKLQASIGFKWNEIIDLAISSDKIKIKVKDSNGKNKCESLLFFVIDYKKHSKNILELCLGYHDLHLRRRKSDSIDVQQMKQNALEFKQRRETEKAKLLNEKKMRLEAEKRREELEARLNEFEKHIKQSNDALLKAEETANLLNERVKLAEEETKLLCMKSSKLEAQVNLYKLLAEKKEREKRFYEYKTVESELILNHILDKRKSNSNSINGSDFDLRMNSNFLTQENLDKIGGEFRKLSLENNLHKIHKLETENQISRRFEFYKDDIKTSRELIRSKLSDSFSDKHSDVRKSMNLIRAESTKIRVEQFKE